MKTNIIKFSLAIIGMIILNSVSHAQNQIWPVGNQSLSFDQLGFPVFGALPTPTGTDVYQGQPAEYASNAYHNPVDGSLLFFVVDYRVYDQDGFLIDELRLSSAEANGLSEIVIVPDPNDCKRYYILTVVNGVFLGGVYGYQPHVPVYAILDFGENNIYEPNRKGAFVENMQGNVPDLGFGNCFIINPDFLLVQGTLLPGPKFAVSPKRTDDSHLIFISDSYSIQRYVLDANGIQPMDITSTPSPYISFGMSDFVPPGSPIPYIDPLLLVRGELELAILQNGNMRLAVPMVYRNSMISAPYTFTQNLGIFVVELLPDGSVVSGSNQIIHLNHNPSLSTRPYVHGLEFSPNANILYVSHVATELYPNPLMFYDFNNPSSGLQNVNVNLAFANDFAQSHIELASNGYLLMATSNRIAPVSNPNNPSAPAWINNYLPITYAQNSEGQTPSSIFSTYVLPDQMDFDPNCQIGCYSYTCGDGSAAEACCQFYSNTNVAISGDILITQNTTWSPGIANNPFQSANGQVNLDANIIVNPGVTLTIDNMTLRMSPNSKITVERGLTTAQAGGTLTVVNSTLTKSNACGACSMWPGIEVQGHPTVASTSNSHATATFSNSTVEYAYFGVMAGTFIAPNSLSFNNNRSGGRIVSANSTFRNNKFDVFFMPYNFPNASQFLFTNFLSDNDLMKNLTGDIIHAYLWNVQNVRFFSCNFENLTAFKPDGESRGIGIGSVNSHFIVDKYFIGNIDPTFNKLDIGVRTAATSSGLNYVVQRAIFNNNYNGIVSEGELNSHILKNTFNIYKAGPDNAVTQTYGVVMSGCNRYRIEENLFQDASPNLNINAFNYGCRIASSGPFANVVEKNEFRNLRSAGISSGVNAQDYSQISTKKAVGLQWLCNDFYNNKTHDLWVSSGRISPFQGTCFSGAFIGSSQPAGNVFNTSNNPQWHVRLENGVLPITYYHRMYDYNTDPTLISAGVTSLACFMPSNAVVCGRQTQVPGLTTGDARDSLNSYFDEKMMFESTLDYGSREELLLDVLGAFLSPEQKRDLLLGSNTTISDEVLIKYLQTAPSNTLLFQVMLENSPLSDKVLYYVMEESTLPSGMKQQLLNAQNGISIYDASMQYLQNIELEIMNIENELIYRYLSDTTNTYSILDVIDLIESYPSQSESSMESLFGAYVRAGLYDKADSLNTILKANYEESDYGILTDLVLASIQTDYNTMIATDSTLLEQLEEWSTWSDQRFGPFARTLLTNYYGYFFPVAFDEGGGTRNMAYPNYKLQDFEPEITIFPNPTTDNFFIVFDENADVSPNREARVYDLAGNLQFTRSFADNAYVLEINTNNMSKGMYIVVISANGTDVGTYKVAVR
jgi:hypothetical protein